MRYILHLTNLRPLNMSVSEAAGHAIYYLTTGWQSTAKQCFTKKRPWNVLFYRSTFIHNAIGCHMENDRLFLCFKFSKHPQMLLFRLSCSSTKPNHPQPFMWGVQKEAFHVLKWTPLNLRPAERIRRRDDGGANCCLQATACGSRRGNISHVNKTEMSMSFSSPIAKQQVAFQRGKSLFHLSSEIKKLYLQYPDSQSWYFTQKGVLKETCIRSRRAFDFAI